MKSLLAPIAAGVVVAGLLYGLLWAAERRLPESEDPWLDAFIAEGLKGEFRSVSTEPLNSLMAGDLRKQTGEPAFAGTVLRNYLVQNTSVQVVRLPKTDLLPEIQEGRKLDQKLKQGSPIHVCRSGRLIAFVASAGKWIPIIGQMKTPKKDVEAVFDAFEETAKRYP